MATSPHARDDAERVASFVLERLEKKAGKRAFQAKRKVPLGSARAEFRARDELANAEAGQRASADAAERATHPSLSVCSSTHLLSVSEDAILGLVGLADETHAAVVRVDIPSPDELLALQARGVRVVSILADEIETAPHEDPLAFALHDLCHLHKFQIDHEGQVGFFEMIHNACILHAFELDEAWNKDAIAVTTDMNGSPVFLLAALKMRLKMAVRRDLARRTNAPAPQGGPLSAAEEDAFNVVFERFLDRCSLHGVVRDVAREITARRQGVERAQIFLDAMTARGKHALARARTNSLPQVGAS